MGENLDTTLQGIIILIVVAAILLFGASKIPELFRSLGRAVGEFKKGRMEAEAEAMQMQSQIVAAQQPQKTEDLETKIKELERELEELKRQRANQQKS
jgi:sec-independent protein translocase protein TatA